MTSTTFPNGYSAFYCMKYELSQGGYRDFLNTLSYTQQVNHMAVAPSSIISTWILNSANRNYLKIKSPGTNPTTPAEIGCDADGDLIWNESTDGENIACNFLSWVDQAAYLVWAGLRPLTELEYEKAARGIQSSVAGEYAWGNANIFNTLYTLSNTNQNTEIVSNPATAPTGNANCAPTYPTAAIGPMRNGIFATATSNRITSGGSFYGVMELSGNLWEQVITTANAEGRNFIVGTPYADLDVNGYAWNGVTTWPGGSSGKVNGSTNALGVIYRGGAWGTAVTNLRISDRSGGLLTNTGTIRNGNYGIRGCASAP
jgi:formylglycine-generating enzyme required for sulfatase activity